MAPWPPTTQAPWSPTAQAFAQHQFSHVTNFWKQGRPASFRLEALPDGNAELNLTFKLPKASEVIPPPLFSSPAPLLKRPIIPLFPEGYAPQKGKPKQAPKLPSRRRKNYRRSVLHKAALAMPTLPPPVNGSLRQAAQACVQRLQAASALPVSTPTTKKRSYSESDSPSALSPSNFPPLAQKIRSDLQISEESPERELLRTQPTLMKSPSPSSPRSFPPPSPLAFTPTKIQVEESAPEEGAVVGKSDQEDVENSHTLSCVNCDAEMTPDHQCDSDEQRFTKYLMRWSQRLEERTDDSALKSRLLEGLVDAVRTPASVLPDRDLWNFLQAMKNQFVEGDLTPVQFLEKMQSLLRCSE